MAYKPKQLLMAQGQDEQRAGWRRHEKHVREADQFLKIDKQIARTALDTALNDGSGEDSEHSYSESVEAWVERDDDDLASIRAKTSRKAAQLDKAANEVLGEKPLAAITRGGGETKLTIWCDEMASGMTRDAFTGRYVPKDGLISRKGYRRILPTSEDPWLREQRQEDLEEVASEILHGRNATVFEALVLHPLRALGRRTPEDLAKQFGVKRAKIDKIKSECVRRVRERIEQSASPKPQPTERREEICEVCNRVYELRAWPRIRPVCKGRFGRDNAADGRLNSKCLYAVRLNRWEKRLAAVTPEKRSQMEAEYRRQRAEEEARRLRENAKWNARYEAERAELAALKSIYIGSEETSEAYNALREAASLGNDHAFEEALASFRRLIGMRDTSLLPAFDSIAAVARDGETDEAFWNAVEALGDVGAGDVKAALDKIVFGAPKK